VDPDEEARQRRLKQVPTDRGLTKPATRRQGRCPTRKEPRCNGRNPTFCAGLLENVGKLNMMLRRKMRVASEEIATEGRARQLEVTMAEGPIVRIAFPPAESRVAKVGTAPLRSSEFAGARGSTWRSDGQFETEFRARRNPRFSERNAIFASGHRRKRLQVRR
jgi:hypothetical protein